MGKRTHLFYVAIIASILASGGIGKAEEGDQTPAKVSKDLLSSLYQLEHRVTEVSTAVDSMQTGQPFIEGETLCRSGNATMNQTEYNKHLEAAQTKLATAFKQLKAHMGNCPIVKENSEAERKRLGSNTQPLPDPPLR